MSVWIVFFIVIVGLGWFSYRYAWWRPHLNWNRPRILMYHMVREHIPGAKFNKLRVTPAHFEQQVKWLSEQGFHFVTMHQLCANWGKHPDKTVAITFDDGYEDNLRNALPILKKYNASATIYVVVDRHERDWSSYKKAHHNTGELARETKLTDLQIKQLVDSGLIEIGSHTLTHANLAAIDDQQRLQEMTESRYILQQQTGQAINSFAYPFGIYSKADVEAADQAGYLTAVTTVEGVDELLPKPDFLQLKRIKVSGKDNMLAFKCRIRTGQRGL
ncbi:polysaccharide deacetylase family protein [Alkanindiges illinoisensis]|uniref:Polysaccharide deacetylase family protein n=1 Tax=Alkanindiges illinoisensis TaxID=197183 RepID=A0A4Y7X915_9GAMM|nr:polysaccharide deacetylase family protein [Alkanindiges illinoisensis]TEU23828.1 polysaccharide deacetylase family protein [Alkanindiges illinoisensis]